MLRAAPELSAFSDRQLRPLLSQVDEVWLAAGELVAVEGRSCDQFLVVLDGILREHSGRNCRLLRAGETFGWDAMRERGVNDATVLAETDVRLLVMGHAQFRAARATTKN